MLPANYQRHRHRLVLLSSSVVMLVLLPSLPFVPHSHQRRRRHRRRHRAGHRNLYEAVRNEVMAAMLMTMTMTMAMRQLHRRRRPRIARRVTDRGRRMSAVRRPSH